MRHFAAPAPEPFFSGSTRIEEISRDPLLTRPVEVEFKRQCDTVIITFGRPRLNKESVLKSNNESNGDFSNLRRNNCNF
jgi:hypothetical protein